MAARTTRTLSSLNAVFASCWPPQLAQRPLPLTPIALWLIARDEETQDHCWRLAKNACSLLSGILAVLPATTRLSMTLSTQRAQAFTVAQEAMKQEITLATGIFALTLTFLKDFTSANTDKTLLEFAWGGYLLSVLFGVFALMCLAGQLETADDETEPTINGPGIRFFAIIQALLFIVALLLTLIFGIEYAKV
jgi:hypothetical protein